MTSPLGYQLKVMLLDVEPPVWRRVKMPGSMTLDRLHTVIQKAMGWQDAHLHEFEVKDHRYGRPEPDEPEYEVEPDWKIALRTAAPLEGKSFTYLYDLGDTWRHEVLVERIVNEPLRYPVCLAGERRCPPEDCGGPAGYAELLEIIGDPDHPEHKERREWLGRRFDPEAFDLAAVNRKLRLLK